MTTTLKFFKTHENVELPKFATEQSACFDLAYSNAGKHEYTGYNSFNAPYTRTFTTDKLFIAPHERTLVPTGLILDIPFGHSVRIHPRSGLSLRKGIVLANAEGVVDSDYTQELFLLIHNMSDVGFEIFNGDRLAQGELVIFQHYSLEETKDKPGHKSSRQGGMGSTGVGVNWPSPDENFIAKHGISPMVGPDGLVEVLKEEKKAKLAFWTQRE